jgi:hypothetical protein
MCAWTFTKTLDAYHTLRSLFTLNLYTQVHKCDIETVMHMIVDAKIRVLRQLQSKPNKAGLTREQIPKRASQFS